MTDKITAIQRHKLVHFVKELKGYRGRHTELVSVYVPAGYSMSSIVQHLQEEQGTASNIKSKSTKDNVIAALERMIRHLQLYENTPPNGLAAFAGNISEREGQQKIEVWSIEPPVPMNQRLYRCDKEFVLEPLEGIADDKVSYGMLVIDKREADVAILKGTVIVPLAKTTSNVPGKTRAGGQCLNPKTLILGDNGNIFPIKKVHNPSLIQGMKNLKNSPSRVLDVWSSKKNLFKVITKHPRIELEASKDHVFFVFEEGKVIEKPLKKLKQGDLLLLKEKIDIKGKSFEFLPIYYNSYKINRNGRKELKRSRELKGLSQKELAKELGFTQTAISIIELGKRNPRRETLVKILDELGIDFIRFVVENCKSMDNVQLPTTLTKELAQLVGYVTGDGHIEKERITLFEQNKNVARSYQGLMKSWKANTSLKFREKKNYYQIRGQGQALSKLLRKEFSDMKESIPEKVLQSNNKVLASYIKGLFDAEGFVSSHLALSMHNETIIKQLQLCLLRFGIISSYLTYDNRANPYSNNIRHTIQISEKESLKIFEKEIGFSGRKKKSRLQELISKKSDMSRVRQVLANGKEVREIIEKHGYSLEIFPKVSGFFNGKRFLSKNFFEKSILNYIEDENLKKDLKQFLEREFVPVKIEKIEEQGLSDTIDISTTTQNFLAQGILVHNSAHRFERLREGAAKEFYRRVADHMKDSFLGNEKIKGILIGGPGRTKQDFLDQSQLVDEVKQKVIAMKDLSYTGDFGLQELLEKCEDVLSEEEVMEEKKAVQKFLNMLATKANMVEYGEAQVMKAIKMGAVDKLLLSETLNDEVMVDFEKEAEAMRTEVMIISSSTREGSQLVDLGKVAAMLRYPIQKD